MKATFVVVFIIVFSSLIEAQQQVPSAGALPSRPSESLLPTQMRAITDTLAGNWSITWVGKDGEAIGEGEEVWKFAPGESAFVEENRSKVRGQVTEDYAAIWWDAKARLVRGIWCDPTINDEGCSTFTVILQGKSVVLTGEWEYQGKKQAWQEVFSRTGTVKFLPSASPATPCNR